MSKKLIYSKNILTTLKSLTLLLTIILLINECKSQTDTCPDYSCPKVLCDLKLKEVQNFCSNVKCSGINVANCTLDSSSDTGKVMYEEHVSMCGCCPGCVKYLGVGESCLQYPPDPTPNPSCTGQFCPILMHRCAPGLDCPLVGPSEKKCSLKGTSVPSNDLGELDNCHNKRALAFSNELYWTPQCDEDETFSPKQCKGTYSNGICFCVSKQGVRIFGTEYQNKAQNQTCECSRQVYELRESGHIASFHCSPEGNYEALQCDTESGLCYCVEPLTGKMTGAVSPENQWKSLPCYSVNYTNFNPDLGYYRICESEWAIAKRLELEASLHGLKVLSSRRITCDLDGSFAPVQNMDKITSCVTKGGGLIGNYRDTEDTRVTNCQCVRDEIKARQDGIPFLKKCATVTGNYDWISPVDHTEPLKWQCVDKDGIFFGDMSEDLYKCCLIGDLDLTRNCDNEPLAIREMCYDPNAVDNDDKIRPCYYWPQ